MKNCTGRITFSDSLTLGEGACHKIVPKWHLEAELRARAWYGFCTRRSRSSTRGRRRPRRRGDGRAKEEERPDRRCCARLRELEHAAREKGLHRIERHTAELAADPTTRAEVHGAVCAELEGVDLLGRREPRRLWKAVGRPVPVHRGDGPRQRRRDALPLRQRPAARAARCEPRARRRGPARAARRPARALAPCSVGRAAAARARRVAAYTCPTVRSRCRPGTAEDTTTETVQDYSDVQVHLFFHYARHRPSPAKPTPRWRPALR